MGRKSRAVACAAIAVGGGFAVPLAVSAPAQAAQRLGYENVTPHELTGPTSGAPTTMQVPDLAGPLTDVQVNVRGLTTPDLGDVDLLLVGPTGIAVVLHGDVDTAAPADGLTLRFHDGAPAFPGGDAPSGSYAPTDLDPSGDVDDFPAPAPAPNATALSAFDGTAAGGTWSLYAVDDAGTVSGELTGGWALRLTIASDPCLDVPEDGFADVAADDVHEPAIDCLVAHGVATGTTATTFDPTGNVSRAQMASFVARAVDASTTDLPATPADAFGDDTGSNHERRINQLAAAGVIGGNGEQGASYLPSADMRRDHMASFMANAFEFVTGRPLPAGDDAFTDDDGNPFEADIDALAAAGVITGTGAGTFDPAGTVSRAQMASFLARFLQLLDSNLVLDV